MSGFRIIVDVETDDAGATHAAKAIREMLGPVYGRIGTRTLEAVMFDAYWGLRTPLDLLPSRSRMVESEHTAPRNGRRR